MGFAKNHNLKQTRVWTWARDSWLGESVRASRRYSREFWTWAGESIRACKMCSREFWAWARSEQVPIPHVDQLTKSIAALHMGASGAVNKPRDPEAPIFMLSTGHRTGSTLLQRILVTDPRVLLWGEPLGDMALVCRIAEMMSNSICPWNLEQWKNHNPTSSSIATSWIADLYPPGEDFRLALRALFDRWLGEPARQLGFARWGLKEVRLGATEAILLHWLYPHAKFVILSRHPYDCYRSLADSEWLVYQRYPDICIDSAAGFAGLWNRLATSWSELPVGFPYVHLKYEDLIDGKVDFRALESWLGIEIKEKVALSVAVGGTARRGRLSWCERWIIAREAAAGMRALGYSE
jgi:hypothetical protein